MRYPLTDFVTASRVSGSNRVVASRTFRKSRTARKVVRAQVVDATLACSLLAGVWKPKVFLGR
jgi:hypothetical protein